MSNAHANLPDDQLHVAKGFSDSSKGGTVFKNQAGEQVFTPLMILPNAIDHVNSLAAPPTEVDGDVYLLDTTGGTLEIASIAWQSGNTVRYNFSGTPDLSVYTVGDYVYFSGNANAENNGSFAITAINNGSDYFEITNSAISSAAKDEASTPGQAKVTKANWDGCQQNSWVKFNGSTWQEIVPTEGASCFLTTPQKNHTFLNDNWIIPIQVNLGASYVLKCSVKQVTTGAPSVEEHINTMGTITKARSAAGNYTLSFIANYFASPEKVNMNWNITNDHAIYNEIRADLWFSADNEITIRAFGDGTELDSLLNYMYLNIEIYP